MEALLPFRGLQASIILLSFQFGAFVFCPWSTTHPWQSCGVQETGSCFLPGDKSSNFTGIQCIQWDSCQSPNTHPSFMGSHR